MNQALDIYSTLAADAVVSLPAWAQAAAFAVLVVLPFMAAIGAVFLPAILAAVIWERCRTA